ncbi:MAG: neocarzinostatin apoprotein domain-containing protein [Halioglobus sp.]
MADSVLCAALLLLGACSSSDDNGAVSAALPQDHAVGMTSMTFIDTSRPTAAHGPVPEASTRTIETTIMYPAAGIPGAAVATGADVDRVGRPFPLIVLSHGLGGTIEYLLPLAEVWAARGYVVALPKFPLTHNATPGGPVAQDVQNQPADVSFVIDELLAESNTSGGLLNNAVNAGEIAASGHSNGGITTYGLVANSCCRDQRIDAAVVLSGAVSPFAGGEYDLSDTPPILVVHGVDDVLTNYNQAVRDYNQIRPPKGLLTLEASSHGSYLATDDAAFDVFAQATADFLDGELRSDSAALGRLPDYQVPGVATMHWAPDDASNIPVELLPEPETNRQAFLSADSDLVDGQVITVTWSGFLPGKVVNIMQCTGDVNGGAAACNISGGIILYPDPEGMGSLELVIHTGPIGNGVCDSANPCTVIVNDASLTEEEAIIRIPITLAD